MEEFSIVHFEEHASNLSNVLGRSLGLDETKEILSEESLLLVNGERGQSRGVQGGLRLGGSGSRAGSGARGITSIGWLNSPD